MRVCIGKAYTRPCVSIRSDTARRLILKLHDESDNLVAHCFLPYKFVVRANGNDTGVDCEIPEHATVQQQTQWHSNLSASILQRLAPAEGPVSGGPTILLTGINFPPPYQQIVYARFGAVVVPTVWLLFFLLQNTHSIGRSGTIHTRSSASCLLLRLRGQSALHSHYVRKPEDRNSVRVTARLDII